MDTCIWLGIYPDNIEKSSERAEEMAREFGLTVDDIDKIWDSVKAKFDMLMPDCGNFGNFVSTLIYEEFDRVIAPLAKENGMETDWCVNGADTDYWHEEQSDLEGLFD